MALSPTAPVGVLFLGSFICSLGLNPCSIDPFACVPIEDFDVNCTCFLTADDPINATDDVFLFFMGHRLPFHLFRQIKMPELFRKKLDIRLPKKHDYESALEMPETIFKNLHMEETMAFFVANSSLSSAFVDRFINESMIRTEELRNYSARWCAEGECNAFVYSTITHNRTAGIYSHAADLLHVIDMGRISLFAVSSAIAQFDMAKVHKILCENKCERFYWNEGILCRQKCTQGLRFDKVAVVGQLKRQFEMFVRGSAVYNLREKYHKYLINYQK